MDDLINGMMEASPGEILVAALIAALIASAAWYFGIA